MRVPCCSVCQMRYDEEDRVPLLLQCGHGFCKECLSRMFSASPDTNLSCPRCRHVSNVGNSVQALRKNFAVLALIHPSGDSSFDCDFTDDENDGDPDEEEDGFGCRSQRRRNSQSQASSSGCGGGGGGGCGIDLGSHHDLRLVRPLGGEAKRAGYEMWSAVLSSGSSSSSSSSSGCRHRVAVKRVTLAEETDLVWVQSRLESMRRASMWCRNVCTFHGAVRMDGRLCLVMDRCSGSIQSEMQQNEGRLTLEQILRYGADIARGVAELHAAGGVCMNIKPSNLLLDASGRAVVSDYGLPEILKKPSCRKSRSVPEDDNSRLPSCMDCTMLSPHYTAPEAWEPLKKSLNLFWDDGIGISAESDAWSFGCTLVEMCTGFIPYVMLS